MKGMFFNTSQKYSLLNKTEASLNEEDNSDQVRQSRRPGIRALGKGRILVAGFVLLSLACNLLLSYSLRLARSRPDHCRSNITDLAYDTPKIYEANWGRKNETEADAYWENLDASPVIVALRYDEAASKYGLPRSVKFPWDNEKGLYYIKAFHHIHCLKLFRKMLKHGAYKESYQIDHLYHCLDSMRQDIMCKPDDTLMWSLDKPHVIGDNQLMQCRDWNRLVAWARDPHRHSCYKIFADDLPVAHKLELYAFCPEDSPHYKKMKAYFDRHGHQPVYDESVRLEMGGKSRGT